MQTTRGKILEGKKNRGGTEEEKEKKKTWKGNFEWKRRKKTHEKRSKEKKIK